MELNDNQYAILWRAWLLAREGKGQVLEDWSIPDAHELCEAGWLERRVQDGELTWWWTKRAEAALDLSALLDSQSPN